MPPLHGDNKVPANTPIAPTVQPTQVRWPSRTTIRTVFQALIAVCAMAPVLVAMTGLQPDQLPWLGGILALAALVTRVMAQPQVETFLRRFAPWLSAAPKPIPQPAPVAAPVVPPAVVRKVPVKKAAKRSAKKSAPKTPTD